MKAKLRRQLSAKLKELGIPSKLYRGSKFLFHRAHSGKQLRWMLHRLELSTPGALVNDCDYLNHVVKGFVPQVRFYNTNKRWYGHGRHGYFLDDVLQVEFVDGRWSCGCPASPCDPLAREEIEKCLLDFYEHNYPGDAVDEVIRLRREALRAGRHIVDERGLLLPAFING